MALGMDDDLTLPYCEVGEMFCCFRADGLIIDANEEFCSAVGLQVQELLGRNLTEFLYGDADQALADIVDRLYLEQFNVDCPCRFRDSQNRPLRQRWSFRAEYDNQGEIILIKGLGYAILPQKRHAIVLNDAWAELKSEMSRKTTELLDMNHRLQKALAERQQAEQDYQTLIDNANEMIYVHDLEGKFMSTNKAGKRILGDNFEGMTVFDVLAEEYRPMVRKSIEKKVRDNTPSTHQVEVITHDGRRLALEVSSRPIIRNEAAYGIQGIARDITERRQTELALIQSEQRLMDIINFLPDATFVIDREGKVIAWNRAIEEMTGIRAADILGQGDHAYALPFYGERRAILIDLVLRPGELGNIRYMDLQYDHDRLVGESYCPGIGHGGAILQGTASPLCDMTGSVVGAIESIRDITERKNTEQQLQGIIDFLPDATFVINRAGRVIAWNRAIEQMTGIKPDQMIGNGNYEYALPFYGERRPILIDLVLAPDAVGRDQYLTIESEYNHLSGESFCPMVGIKGRILYGTASPLYDATGKIVGAIESIRDITERKNTEQQLRDIINFMPDATLVVNASGKVIHWNRAIEEMTGIRAQDIIGKGDYEYAVPFTGQRKPILIDGVISPALLDTTHYGSIEQKGNVFSGELFCPEIGAQGVVLIGTATPLYDVTGTMVGAIETVRDITEQKKIEVALRTSEENFRKLAEIAPAMIFVLRGDGIIYVNQTAEIITGYTRAQLVSQPPGVIIHPDCRDWAEAKSLGWLQGIGVPDRYQTRLVKRDGATVWLDLSVTPIDFSGHSAILGVGIDITEQKLAEDKIRYLSYHDKLTGLYNRAYFEEQLKAFDDEQYLPLSLIMGDLNGLKMVNDAFGHVKGDQLLRNVARVLESCCRSQDIIARWGGDEFVVLLPNTREDEAGKIAETISKSCLAFDDFPVQVSISVGIATKSSVAKSMENVSKEAEDQMYRTKLLDSKSNRSTFMNSLEKTLWVRSHETQAHTHRLRSLVVEIARSLQLSSSDIQSLNLLASLHDIGKIAVPNTILDKPGRLTEEEWEMMKKHPEIGYRIAMSSPELAVIAEAILTHHERWDGTGYPMGLKGLEIPLHARILSIADAYDVMISGRPYQTEICQADALNEIARCAGSQFDPGLARLFIRLVQTDFAPDECGSDLNCFGWNEEIR